MMHELAVKNITLPSLPAIGLRILDAVKKDSSSYQELAKIILVDPALTVMVLKVANSSFYGMPNRISTIDKALSVLGLNATRNIALSFVISKELTGPESDGFNFTYFWKRAVTSAVSAELLASMLHYKNDDLFVSALLQDIGVLVLHLCCSREYQQVLDEKRLTEASLFDIEQKILGTDHQEIGADLLLQWGLPKNIATIIRYHHTSRYPEEVSTQVNILRWSTMLAAIYFGSHSVENVQRLKAAICPSFNIAPGAIDTLIDTVAEKSVEVLSFFEIDPGEMKPFSLLLQEANEELRRINLSYEQVVMQAKQARRQAEELAAELLAANAKLRNMAFRDGLTGLYNYRYFHELMDRELNRSMRHHQPMSLLAFDIDHFKKINDAYGHPAGDEVLRTLATLVLTTMRTSDMVARYGGEEFAVILPMTDLAGGKVFAERLRQKVEGMETAIADIMVKITISIGLTSYEPEMMAAHKSQLIDASDAALYQAKQNGRNRVHVMALQV